MKYLEKIWVRGLISFFFGEVIPEWIRSSIQNPNTAQDTNFGLLLIFLIVAIYVGLSAYVKRRKRFSNF